MHLFTLPNQLTSPGPHQGELVEIGLLVLVQLAHDPDNRAKAPQGLQVPTRGNHVEKSSLPGKVPRPRLGRDPRWKLGSDPCLVQDKEVQMQGPALACPGFFKCWS